MDVIWSETALFQLKNIFNYYSFVASKIIAKKITTDIVDRTISLKKFPEMGMIQIFDPVKVIKYKYLVEGNYKILYHIIDNTIKITAVFDTRQEPEKLDNLLDSDL